MIFICSGEIFAGYLGTKMVGPYLHQGGQALCFDLSAPSPQFPLPFQGFLKCLVFLESRRGNFVAWEGARSLLPPAALGNEVSWGGPRNADGTQALQGCIPSWVSLHQTLYISISPRPLGFEVCHGSQCPVTPRFLKAMIQGLI